MGVFIKTGLQLVLEAKVGRGGGVENQGKEGGVIKSDQKYY